MGSEGIPLFYYGDELFLHKDNPTMEEDRDPYNQPMMLVAFLNFIKKIS